MVIILWLVVLDINLLLSRFLFDSIIVTWRECIDINDSTVSEDLIVDQRREALSTKSEPNMTSGSCVKETCLGWVNTLQQLHGFTLLLEVDQILVILEDLDVCEGTPGILDLFSSDLILRLLGQLAATLLVASPGPLDLNGGDVVHGKAVILE